jgi:hypothetical protein
MRRLQRRIVMNKAMIESLLRHVLGAGLAGLTAVMAAAGAVTPLELGLGDWLIVLGSMWAALVPPLVRYLNTKDPAFGRIAGDIAEEISAKLEEAAAKAAKPTKPRAPAKKSAGSGGGTSKQVR